MGRRSTRSEAAFLSALALLIVIGCIALGKLLAATGRFLASEPMRKNYAGLWAPAVEFGGWISARAGDWWADARYVLSFRWVGRLPGWAQPIAWGLGATAPAALLLFLVSRPSAPAPVAAEAPPVAVAAPPKARELVAEAAPAEVIGPGAPATTTVAAATISIPDDGTGNAPAVEGLTSQDAQAADVAPEPLPIASRTPSRTSPVPARSAPTPSYSTPSYSYSAPRSSSGSHRSHGNQGGHYAGGSGSSHKGGHYVNPRTNNHYTRHR